jgi:Arylsulfotransferase (ASST)
MSSPRRTIPILVAALAVVLGVSAGGSPSRGAPATPTVDVYPIAGTRVANPATTVSFRGSTNIKGLMVSGSKTKTHSGRLVTHSDGKGVSFVPDERFREDELVTVHSTTRLTGATDGGNVRFRIYTRPDKKTLDKIAKGTHSDPEGDPAEAQHFRSRTDLRPPDLKITTNEPGASRAPIFLAVKAGPGQNGPTIRDADGRLIWFRRTSAEVSPYDFRAQVYRGKPVLTWWQGVVRSGKGRGYGVMLNRSYREIHRVKAGNGFAMDQHEFELTPRATAFINVYEPVRYSLKPAGGKKDGAAWDSIVQEIDVKTGMVLFEWHSLAHVSVALGTFPLRESSDLPYDPFHVNSVSEDGAGNLLLSARNTNALFLVDRHNGRLLGRIGGKKSDYETQPGAGLIGQHQATLQSNGTITVFDNGGSTRFPTMPDRESRGVRIRVDGPSRTVSLLEEYKHPGEAMFSRSQGSMQVLPNGNAFLTWGGGNPYLTEMNPDGHAVFESYINPKSDDTYRAYRMPWHATPRDNPVAVAFRATGKVDVYASWNGATEVARWEVLTGDDPANLSSSGKFDFADFETHMEVLTATSPKYVAVRALNSSGAVLGTSVAVAPK